MMNENSNPRYEKLKQERERERNRLVFGAQETRASPRKPSTASAEGLQVGGQPHPRQVRHGNKPQNGPPQPPSLKLQQLNLGDTSRKRGPGSDVQPSQPNLRSASPAKASRTSFGKTSLIRPPNSTDGRPPDTKAPSLLVATLKNRQSEDHGPTARLHHTLSRDLGETFNTRLDSTVAADDASSNVQLEGTTLTSAEAFGRAQAESVDYDKDLHHELHEVESLSGDTEGALRDLNSSSLSALITEPNTELIKQPDSRPISQEQLAAEVTGIYAGLVMIEAKCIKVVGDEMVALRDSKDSGKSESPDQLGHRLRALIALHRTLLYEFHDFFLASQHPCADDELKALPAVNSMPARLWRYGIFGFLELLRHQLPKSSDHLLAFWYLAFQMMALLYETVRSYEDTWLECLGDLSRYRMAIEHDASTREVWTGVARYWYYKAADKLPGAGRLYHHLGILARRNALQQLSLYSRSVMSVHLFSSTPDIMMTLFKPILARSDLAEGRVNQVANPDAGDSARSAIVESRSRHVDALFIRIHALQFTGAPRQTFQRAVEIFLAEIEFEIDLAKEKWKDSGAFMAVSNLAGVLEYGNPAAAARNTFPLPQSRKPQTSSSRVSTTSESHFSANQHLRRSELESETKFPADRHTLGLLSSWAIILPMLSVALQRHLNPNVLPHVHITLAFLWQLASCINGHEFIPDDFPWSDVAAFLNALADSNGTKPSEAAALAVAVKEDHQPLIEDYMIRGQAWAQDYFPADWFDDASTDDAERSMAIERPSEGKMRVDRVLWLGVRLAAVGTERVFTKSPVQEASNSSASSGIGPSRTWLCYDGSSKVFSVTDRRIGFEIQDIKLSEDEGWLGDARPGQNGKSHESSTGGKGWKMSSIF